MPTNLLPFLVQSERQMKCILTVHVIICCKCCVTLAIRKLYTPANAQINLWRSRDLKHDTCLLVFIFLLNKPMLAPNAPPPFSFRALSPPLRPSLYFSLEHQFGSINSDFNQPNESKCSYYVACTILLLMYYIVDA